MKIKGQEEMKEVESDCVHLGEADEAKPQRAPRLGRSRIEPHDDEEIMSVRPGAIAVGGDDSDHQTIQSASDLIQAQVAPSEQELEDRLAQRMHTTIAAHVQQTLQQKEQRNHVLPMSSPVMDEGEAKVIQDQAWYKNKWIWVILYGVLLIAMLGGVVGGVLAASDANDKKEAPFVATGAPTDAPKKQTMAPAWSPTSLAPTAALQTPAFYGLLNAMAPILGPDYDLTVFEDNSTIPYQALDWMANQDLLDTSIETSGLLVERFVAVLLYFAMGGSGWTYQLRFLSPSRVCSWHDFGAVDSNGAQIERGIFCNDDNRVVRLDLLENGIQGQLPEEIQYLSDLKDLDMSFNVGHSGRLTKGVTRLGQLEACSFVENSLSGTIHTEFGTLRNLRDLNLGINHFTGSIPSEIGKATQLERLLLFENPDMSGSIPTELGNLGSLNWLSLDIMGLTGPIPSELGRIGDALEYLLAPINHLEGPLPSELGRLTKLQRLALQENPTLNGPVPVEFSRMVHLTHVLLFGNALTGSLDSVWCDNPQADISNWELVAADCSGNVPEIECSCCIYCCVQGPETCLPNNSTI